MENFVKFVKYFESFVIGDKMGITDNFGKHPELFKEDIRYNINKCRIFNVDDNVKKLLVLSKPPRENSTINLPFDSLFIDVNFEKEELKKLGVETKYKQIIGLLVRQGEFIYDNTLPKYVERKEYDELKKKEGIKTIGKGLRVSLIAVEDNKVDKEGNLSDYVTIHTLNLRVDLLEDEWNVKILKLEEFDNKHTRKFINNFVVSFLNFVNNPDIKIVGSVKSEEQNKKREKRGKCRIPPQHFIKLHGELKRYVDSIGDKHFTYSHRFWVRGHFRTLKAERYKENIGKRKWILPYIKGKGILFDKEYNIEDNSENKIKGVDG